ncbi:MAG: M16 family metallopeptidase [Candidatus Magasanikbacteria bacterium]
MKQNFKNYKLDNGLEIILAPQEDSFTTTVMATAKVGSKHETRELNGISHFLEHLGFKGTNKRPSQVEIASEFENLGATYNAFTNREYTSYYAKGRSGVWGDLLDIIADMYKNSILPEKEIEKERGVIIEEINMYDDDPKRKVFDLLFESSYKNHSLGRSVLGKKEVIKNLSREDFQEYRNENYVANNTIVTVAGNLNPDVEKSINSLFSELKEGNNTQSKKALNKQKEVRELVHNKDSAQTHLRIGFRAFGTEDDRKYPLKILSNVLGGGISSRLFQKIRSEMGAAYYVGSKNHLLRGTGLFLVSAGVKNSKTQAAIKATMKELKKIKEEGIKEKELKKSKNHIIGNLMTGLETSSSLARFYSDQAARSEQILNPEEIIKKLKSVSIKSVKSVANDLFKNKNLNLALIGPFQKGDFVDILNVD